MATSSPIEAFLQFPLELLNPEVALCPQGRSVTVPTLAASATWPTLLASALSWQLRFRVPILIGDAPV